MTMSWHEFSHWGSFIGTMTTRSLPIFPTAIALASLVLAATAGASGDKVESVAADDSRCVVQDGAQGSDFAMPARDDGHGALRVAALQPANRNPSGFRFTCGQADLASIAVGLAPNQVREVTLFLGNTTTRPLNFRIGLFPDNEVSARWLQIEPESGTLAASTQVQARLVVTAPAGFVPETVTAQQLLFTVEDGNREHVSTVTVELEMLEDEPMFRDDFQVDPVIGQFSYLSGR